MISVMLEVTKNCNLRCSYCYTGEKHIKNMTKEIAYTSLQMVLKEAKKQIDKTIEFHFLGGEPLLNYDLIKYCVETVKKEAIKEKIKFSFHMTTNMILLSEEIVEFLIKEKFILKVSIDGNEDIHNLNRVYQNNKGCYSTVLEKLKYLENYNKNSIYKAQVTNVVTKNNYKNFFESFKHLVNLGFKDIDSAIDYTVTWSNEEFKLLSIQIEAIFDYAFNEFKKGNVINWEFMNPYLKSHVNKTKFFPCKAGLLKNYITYDGYIYPCAEINDKVCLGHVNTGINAEKVRELLRKSFNDNHKCNNCDINDWCAHKSCLILNLKVNNSFDIPVEISCKLRKFMYEFINKNFDINMLEKNFKVINN